MTNSSEEKPDRSSGSEGADGAQGIGDDQLPDDLVPGEDNPLAEPLDDDVDAASLDMGTPGPGSLDDDDLED